MTVNRSGCVPRCSSRWKTDFFAEHHRQFNNSGDGKFTAEGSRAHPRVWRHLSLSATGEDLQYCFVLLVRADKYSFQNRCPSRRRNRLGPVLYISGYSPRNGTAAASMHKWVACMDYLETVMLRLNNEVIVTMPFILAGSFRCVHCQAAKAVVLPLTRPRSKRSRRLNRCPSLALGLRAKRYQPS